ncbi:BTAD domain-containing putative transcriptional regulator [Streptomyces sp. CB01881]|uniref:AfsR/SARP family transcriptional regulator n=1 Tax=Streptomyces sp. CB01881 TaxID=2078691 RepID=UPI000CDBF5C5|nr:BTAD domain-containing putative transcriptional regulator [Streptomyces sp. CB01881]AUY53045.1 AfsR family transcriptional regulator [Streptomyces sp. CB01881]TYC70760.1 AfsR family transcriptional regulator [Streptomyces sp. CB01881]
MADMGGSGLRFGLLGPVRAWYGERELELGRPQQRAVLAVLLDAGGRTVATSVLVEGVWGGAEPADPRKAVQLAVSRLRAAFRPYAGDDPQRMPLARVGDGYALRVPEAEVDVAAWEALLAGAERLREADAPPQEVREVLRRAQRLWTGEPLAGLPGPHAEAVRARLAEQRISAKEAQLGLDAELGDRTDLTAEAAALALEHPGRPRLTAVLMRALYQAGRKTEALAVYEDARAALPPGPSGEDGPAALQLRILREDPALLPTAAATSATAAADPAADSWQVPDQLPSGLADFTGRSEEAEALADRLAAAGGRAVVVSALDGMGGVGKTTLAVHVARRMRGRFPDGQLFADLRGADHTPPDPGTVLAGFLRALGVAPAEIPPDTRERSALYRSALAGRRVLVVLDNAATPGHVEPLLPGSAGCAVLITSRHRLDGLAGAHQMRLDTLPPGQALELLTRIVGAERAAAEPGAAEEIVRACGLLPLAVRIVASRLAADPSLTLAALAEGLRREHRLAEISDGERTVEASFALSYHRLDAELTRAFRLLALSDAPDVPLPCAAALLDRPEAETGELLETLVDLNLLHSPRYGRYGFHDLVRAYARGRLAAEDGAAERTAAAGRLTDFCLATARNADRAARKADPVELSLLGVSVHSPGRAFADGAEAVRWMREQAEVHAAAIALSCADPDLPLDRAAELADRMGAVLAERTQTTVIADLAERLAREAAARGDHGALALARYLRGANLWHVNRYAESEEEIRRAVELCTSAATGRVLAKSLLTLGGNARIHGRHAEAAEHAGRAAHLFRRLGAERSEGSALGEFAFSCAQTGRLAEAREAAERCARLMSGSGPVSAATGRYYLARVLRLCGDPEAALAHAAGAREEFAALQVTVFEAAAGDLAARIHAEAGRWLLALDAAEAVLPLARRTSAALEAALLRTLGTALTGLGRPRQARACLAEGLEVYGRLGLDEDAAQVRELLAALE